MFICSWKLPPRTVHPLSFSWSINNCWFCKIVEEWWSRLQEGDELSETTSLSTSLRWKFRWQPQAAQLRAAAVPSAPPAMNSRQPSTAYPPILAAWFFWHSAYLTVRIIWLLELLDPSFLITTCLFFILSVITLILGYLSNQILPTNKCRILLTSVSDICDDPRAVLESMGRAWK